MLRRWIKNWLEDQPGWQTSFAELDRLYRAGKIDVATYMKYKEQIGARRSA